MNTFKKLFVLFILIATNAFSQTTPKEIFQKALEAYYNSDYEKGIKYFDDFIKIASNDPRGFTYRGLCYQSMKNYPKSLDDFSKLINLGKNNPEGYIYRGNTYTLQRNLPAALLDYADAIRYGPDDIEGYLARARVYVIQGDYRNALKDINLAEGVNPKSERVFINKAFVHYLNNDSSEVIDAVNNALYNDSDIVFTDFKRELLLTKVEIFKNSIKIINDRINKYPGSYLNYFMRGFAYYLTNSYDKSKADLKKSVDLKGTKDEHFTDAVGKILRSIKRNS